MTEDPSEDEMEGKVVIRGMDFPSNSNKDREARSMPEPKPERQKAEKIITGKAIQRKKPVGSKIRDIFNGADIRGTFSYVAREIAIPAAKDFALDAVQQALQRMLWGDSYRGSFSNLSRNRSQDRGRIRYDKMSSSSSSRDRDRDRDYRDRDRREMSHRGRADHDLGEIILDSRGEAEMVIDRLRRNIEEYDSVTIAELYDLIEITPGFPDFKYGWVDLIDARVRRIRGGYLLDLPKAILLD